MFTKSIILSSGCSLMRNFKIPKILTVKKINNDLYSKKFKMIPENLPKSGQPDKNNKDEECQNKNENKNKD